MKNKQLLILLALLIGISAYFYFTESSSSLVNEFSDFTIEDTSTVHRLLIADKSGRIIDLKRQEDGKWNLNDKYTARKDGVDLILKTFKLIKIKEPVPKSAMPEVIRRMATQAIKVIAYNSAGEEIKVVYVGHATKDHHGTYMLAEKDGVKSDIPFITFVPGLHGFLTTRFFTEEVKWRDRNIFNVKRSDIKSIELTNYADPKQSFMIDATSDEPSLMDMNGNAIEGAERIMLEDYLNEFTSIHYDFMSDAEAYQIDSVRNVGAFSAIKLTAKDNREVSLDLFYIAPEPGKVNLATGEELEYNIDQLYAHINNGNFVVMQWGTIDRILYNSGDFSLAPVVDK